VKDHLIRLGAALAVLALGVVGGYSIRGGSSGQETPSPSPSTEVEWYTCGMHPSVLQKEPGDCPICQMKLTPMKKETSEGGQDSADGPSERKVLYWRAPMNPNYTSTKPGKSPMGMDLVPVYGDALAVSGTVRINPITMQNMGIRTAKVERGPLARTVRTVGRLDYDERLVGHVNTKFTGWIEKLHVAVTGQKVEKGQPLFDVYSPELFVAQEEFLQAVRYQSKLAEGDAKRYSLQNLESARVKLRYYDVTDEQVDELAKSGKPAKVLTIYSPSSGIVTDKMAEVGMYVKPGMRLYTIADLSRIWVYVDIYEYQLPWVRLGQEAHMTLPYIPGREFQGKVTYIYPYLQKASRVVKVRLEFDNTALDLKPEMYANIRLDAKLAEAAVQLPREAYIDSGLRKLAFIYLGGGKFQPREIVTGVESEKGMVQVLQGLKEGDVVVTSGQFLIDAESKLREAVAKMMAARKLAESKKAGQPAPTSRPTAQGPSEPPPGTKFACPMATHPGEQEVSNRGAYFSPVPGDCPRCGMKLKPIGEVDWLPSSAHEGHRAGELHDSSSHACPMSEHPDAEKAEDRGPYFSDAEGSCPRCGMKLKPIKELSWAEALRAAAGAEVAYACPDHPEVLGIKPGKCPRGGQALVPFKALYTCPDLAHAGQIKLASGECPTCKQELSVYRGPWLDEKAAAEDGVPTPLAGASHRCSTHPEVKSTGPALCTMCAQDLSPMQGAEPTPSPTPTAKGLKSANYACPMEICNHVSEKPGKCPECGMSLKPIAEVAWAREAQAKEGQTPGFTCPMHASIQEAEAGSCRLCGMQLVPLGEETSRSADQKQVDYVTEHYLSIQRLLAADSTGGVSKNALGLASAAEELVKQAPTLGEVARALRASALKLSEGDLAASRLHFSELSSAYIKLLDQERPSRERWPELRLFRCPMAKADWVQASDSIANPYYGFKMRTCGSPQGKR